MKARKTIQLQTVPKLDLSFGDMPGEGFTRPKDVDPMIPVWPLPSGSVEEAFSGYLLNRIPGEKRTEWMQELWRVLSVGGKCTMIVPYWSSPRAIQDPCSAWPPLAEQSFLYWNKSFRETNKLPAVEGCDFDFTYGYTLDPETSTRNDETRPFWIKHYMNAVSDLQVVLTKRA